MGRKLYKIPVTDLLCNVIGYECPEKEIRIVECSKDDADRVIVPHHYSHKVTKNSCINMLVYYKNHLRGALQIGYGIRPKIKGDLNADKTREFDRMWLDDIMPKFSETIVISLLHHFLRKAHKEIKHLISYADTSAGMTGTIYRAASYRLVAELKADFYILANGERVHPVTMWHRHGTRAWAFCKGYIKAYGRPKGNNLNSSKDL